MTTPEWPRTQWRDGGGEALLLWFIFGDFDRDLHIDAGRYRARELPRGVEIVRYANAELAKWNGYPLSDSLGRLLREENPRLFERAENAVECVMLRGAISDPPDLDVLRDAIGAVTALTDLGGVGVVDPQMLSMFGAEEWRRRYFKSDAFDARAHVLILGNEDDACQGRAHVHTRGLRKFARPDISIRNVPANAANIAGELAERFIEFQAQGGLVEDGHRVDIDGAPTGIVARHCGTLDDPEFNNVHLGMRWPD